MREQPSAEGSARAALIVARAGQEGERFRVRSHRMSIGRHPVSDVFLPDLSVSLDHALIVRRRAEFFVVDRGSHNGTYVNRERVESRQLHPGDELRIGKYRLMFELD